MGNKKKNPYDLDLKIPRVRVVSYRHYDSNTSPHPFIRIGGKYLENFGFDIGDLIVMEIEPDRIAITKVTSS
ncbi:MAG: hypothetical protein IIA45_06555 [Bacteroidetes bacterium]|nr:hypothetical protein [Bacteroidota bacterium]